MTVESKLTKAKIDVSSGLSYIRLGAGTTLLFGGAALCSGLLALGGAIIIAREFLVNPKNKYNNKEKDLLRRN
jgi:hypothetical protein